MNWRSQRAEIIVWFLGRTFAYYDGFAPSGQLIFIVAPAGQLILAQLFIAGFQGASSPIHSPVGQRR
jgi:hypothetical protein